MTEKTQPTDAEILDAADDFRSQYKHGGTTFDEFAALDFARAVLAKWGSPVVAGEPVAWQSRTRPTWGSDTTPWTPWELCTKEQAEDYWKCPLLHEWAYEARAIYTTPQPTQAQAGAVPLTAEQAQDLIDLESWGPEAISLNAQLLRTIRRTETAHGITKEVGQP